MLRNVMSALTFVGVIWIAVIQFSVILPIKEDVACLWEIGRVLSLKVGTMEQENDYGWEHVANLQEYVNAHVSGQV